ncbi:MAG: WGR domain-containing protein [Opitutaceae bacterium]|nr:WGR domain-containing protein [Opitutaceae bacterium]
MNNPPLQPAFIAFLQRGSNAGGFGTDDVLAAVLPLFEQVATAHQEQCVAPLDGVSSLLVTGGALGIDPSTLRPPRKNPARIAELQQSVASALDVVAESRQTADLDDGTLDQHDLRIGEPGAELTRPVYLPGYVAWEHRAGHHDPLTDVFSLGLILASCACTLDLTDPEDLERFARHRGNLFALNPHLHPVLASMIAQMTDLNRHRRIQTVDQVIQRLRRYRDQAADFSVDFTRLKGYRDSTPTERGKIILTHLRNRLFEISRRNRLVYFKPTLQTLNLTLASVPLMLDHRNIKPSQLFLWHDALARALSKGESIVLGQYVRFEDAPYASGVLDQIIAGERRDRQEYGFAQLRLVICFLRWHNLKESPEERIHSPLLLLPVELTRKKGVRDAYVLKPLSSEAEVNPALRHHLRQLYGLNLPESIDLGETTLEAFHALLADQIRASEPGVTLTLQNRPQIELIHERARQRLDQFRRRQRLSPRGSARLGAFDYSYDRDRFRPLGLQLFQARVKPARSPFSSTLGAPPTARPACAVAPEPPAEDGASGSLKEQQAFALREPQDGGNPYHWDYDVCSQTLGNFNYRKMSLVQDYAALLEKDLPGSAFDSLFTEKPRTREGAPPPLPLREQYPVVDCDPTQMSAVARARTGQSYIIQGPPGTGKSQTITNLIADYVARGKRVLFVCEKRAAIDVVFHRLGRQGLDDLCCLIHDSQTDKREFIRNLKQTYEGFLAQPLDETLDARRDACARQMEAELAALQRWSTALESRVAESSLTVHALLGRLVELRSSRVTLDPLNQEWVPSYATWSPHAETIRALCAGLKRISGKASLAEHSFRHLSADALTRPQPLTAITAAADEGEKLLATIGSAMESLDETLSAPTLGEIEAMVTLATTLAPAAAADALDLLNPRAARTRAVSKAVRDWRSAEAQLAKSRQATRGWRTKLSPQDTQAALDQAQRLEGTRLRWLHPAAWRLRAVLRERYDFSIHAVPPSWSHILRDLAAEQAAADSVDRNRAALVETLGDLDLEEGLRLIEELPARLDGLSPAAKALHAYLQENPEGTFVVESLAALRTTLTRLNETLHLVLVDATQLTRDELGRELKQLRADLVWLPDVLPLLGEALRLPAELQTALRQLPLNDAQLEAAVAFRSLRGIYQNDRALEASDGRVLAQRVARLQAAHREWLTLNARWIHQQVRRTFLRNVQRSTTPASQLNQEEKELKRRTATGRRELEHEFSKTMRHRSIRDLADDETGAVLRDLKPVWLMSPLSVSDTLPLAVDAFDVAIYDEASQILVEEAIPAVYRARQVIVVGDEMQLPPTNFFSATRSGEASLVDSDDAADAADDLDADSFLTQSARTLPSTLLGWHYRSRYESLISYSNHAFYEARLLTVPDRQRPGAVQPELVAGSPLDPVLHTDALLARAISFHFHPEAVYERRSNTVEAESIALLVRELLARKTGMSLGVVAFSEAQQGEIESALTRLGAEDAGFRNRLEEEYEREENGQFCGLFVKNLENVQGDERDIILLSVCYGYDRSRRMLMNFGPINQRGGEKRLNVIFSRARQHMAVISSIHHFDITNDYNDGANCLRNFLDYAAACSRGDTSTARRVLQASHPTGPIHATSEKDSGVIQQLEVALRERGFWVDRDVGQSTFRLPLAVRRRPEDPHLLGILLDDAAHYAQRDLLERFLLRPSLLESFGWNVVQVFTKDWFHDPEAVLRQIDRVLDGRALAGVEPSPALPETPPETRSLSAAQESPHTALSKPNQPPTAVVKTPGVEPRAPEAPRHFICTEEGTSKFWEVTVLDAQLTVRFGRLGTKGQTQTKAFSTAEAAWREREKLIRSKLAKGYAETNPPPSRQTGEQAE